MWLMMLATSYDAIDLDKCGCRVWGMTPRQHITLATS